MPFDTKKFDKTRFEPRIAEVEVPDLREWFGAGETPVWVVRGLTHAEIAAANEAATKKHQENLLAIAGVLAAGEPKEKAEALRDLMGLAENVPVDTIQRIHHLRIGSIEPEMKAHTTCVKFSETFPVEFILITNRIMELTGKGRAVAGKSKPSGDEATSSSP